MDTVNKETILQIEQKFVKNPNWQEADHPTIYLQSVEELNLGQPKTNTSSGREEDLNPGPPDYKPSAPTTRPRCLLCKEMVDLHPVLKSKHFSQKFKCTVP